MKEPPTRCCNLTNSRSPWEIPTSLGRRLMTIMFTRLWLSAALATLFFTAQPASAQAPHSAKDDKLDLTIKGELKAGDPKDKVTKQPSKVHEVKLKAGQAYVITMDAVDKGL